MSTTATIIILVLLVLAAAGASGYAFVLRRRLRLQAEQHDLQVGRLRSQTSLSQGQLNQAARRKVVEVRTEMQRQHRQRLEQLRARFLKELEQRVGAAREEHNVQLQEREQALRQQYEAELAQQVQAELAKFKHEEEQRVLKILVEMQRRAEELVSYQQWQRALTELERLTALGTMSGNRKAQALGLYRQALVYQEVGELERATILFEQAYKLITEVLPSTDQRIQKYHDSWKTCERKLVNQRVNTMEQQAEAVAAQSPETARKLILGAAELAAGNKMPLLEAQVLNNGYFAFAADSDYAGAKSVLERAAKLVVDNRAANPLVAAGLQQAIDYNLHQVGLDLKGLPFERAMTHWQTDFELAMEAMSAAVREGRDLSEFRNENLEDARADVEKGLTAALQFGPRDWRVAFALDRQGLTVLSQNPNDPQAMEEAVNIFRRAHNIAGDYFEAKPALLEMITQHLTLLESRMN